MNKIIEIPPVSLSKEEIVIETLSAGDSFIAGTLYGLINNFSSEKAVQLGCGVAAEKCKSKNWKEINIE